MDCVPACERLTAFGGLAFGSGGGRGVRLFVGNGFLFFDGYVVKLCGIKDFSALLALDELSIFVARDDFDDGVFAGGGHGWGGANGMDFARIG